MTLCDASPLIALLYQQDDYHHRCLEVLPELSQPLITTLPCFTEALYLLGKHNGWMGQKTLWDLLRDDLLNIHLPDEAQIRRAYKLMAQYADVPMDFGDASLVVAAEVLGHTRIFTLDKDFYIYRLLGNQAFEVVPGLQ